MKQSFNQDTIKLNATLDTLVAAAKLYKDSEKINLTYNGKPIVIYDEIHNDGVEVEDGIENLAAYCQQPLKMKIKKEKFNNVITYLIIRQFTYNDVTFFQVSDVDDNNKDYIFNDTGEE